MAHAFLIRFGVCFSSKFNLDYFVKLDFIWCIFSSSGGLWRVICFCMWVCVFVRKQACDYLAFINDALIINLCVHTESTRAIWCDKIKKDQLGCDTKDILVLILAARVSG